MSKGPYTIIKGERDKSACFFLLDTRSNKVIASEDCGRLQPFSSKRLRDRQAALNTKVFFDELVEFI